MYIILKSMFIGQHYYEIVQTSKCKFDLIYKTDGEASWSVVSSKRTMKNAEKELDSRIQETAVDEYGKEFVDKWLAKYY